jgi:trans-2,3-dihydro-3-hydroxyanthranilate isomerase
VDVDFRLVDVFAQEPFAGNQLCVVPETPAGLDGATMQVLAQEIGFSETTFVTRAQDASYDVRIFTPVEELPFAGHPTLGTAFVLASEGRISPIATQICPAGEVPVEVDLAAGTAEMQQLPPRFGSEVADRVTVAAAAGLEQADLVDGLPIVPVSVGIWHVMVPIVSDDALRRAVRDQRRCHDLLTSIDAEALYLFAVRGPGDVRARMFDRDAEIGEDPATGSAAGPLGAYLSLHGIAGMPGRLTVAQGEQVGRASFLEVNVRSDGDGWTVRVAGGVRIVGEGRFRV